MTHRRSGPRSPNRQQRIPIKVNILASKGDALHVDTFDLYNARCRASSVKLAAAEVAVDAEVIKKDVGRMLLKLEESQDRQIADALTRPETGHASCRTDEPDFELANRCLVLAVNEDRDHPELAFWVLRR